MNWGTKTPRPLTWAITMLILLIVFTMRWILMSRGADDRLWSSSRRKISRITSSSSMVLCVIMNKIPLWLKSWPLALTSSMLKLIKLERLKLTHKMPASVYIPQILRPFTKLVLLPTLISSKTRSCTMPSSIRRLSSLKAKFGFHGNFFSKKEGMLISQLVMKRITTRQ